MINDDIRELFSRNLNTILDNIHHPTAGFGRVSRLAEMFDISRSNAQKWLSGGALPDPSRYAEITSKLSCSLDDLFSIKPLEPAPVDRPVIVSVITDQGTFMVSHPQRLVEALRWTSGAMMLQLSDMAMEPYVVAGDFVTFNPNIKSYPGDGNFVVYINQSFSVRRVQRLASGRYRLHTSQQGNIIDEVPATKVCFGLPPDKTEKRSSQVYFVGPVLGRYLSHR